MEQLKIVVYRLEIREASLVLGQTLKAVKLSFEQAMQFRNRFQSFDEMKEFYGADKVLEQGEHYNGYIAVDNGMRRDIVAMNGALEKRTKVGMFEDPYMARNVADGLVYSCVYRDAHGVFGGKFKYVWTFGDCRFEPWGKELQQRGYLKGENIAMLSQTLKSKLTAAAISDEIFELTESEDLLLRSYLGGYYDDFFIQF